MWLNGGKVPVVQKEGPDVLLGLQSLRDSLVDNGVQQKSMCREGMRLGLRVGVESM